MKTILVVEDEGSLRQYYDSLLNPAYRVLLAQNGKEGVELFKTHNPDVVLMDVEMPVMNGFDACREIRDFVCDFVPVIFVSSLSSVEDKLKGYEAGGMDYVAKPIHEDELLLKISSIVEVVEISKAMKSRLDEVSQVSFSAMTTVGELGVLVQAARKLLMADSIAMVASEAISSVKEYGLEMSVMINDVEAQQIYSCNHVNLPSLMKDAIVQVSSMGRIVEFSSYLAVNYKYVSLLIRNMPADADYRGRLRDHLAMLAELIDGRVQALRNEQVLATTEGKVGSLLAEIDATQKRLGADLRFMLDEVMRSLTGLCIGFGLTDQQEKKLVKMVDAEMDRILGIVTEWAVVQEKLSDLALDFRHSGTTVGHVSNTSNAYQSLPVMFN